MGLCHRNTNHLKLNVDMMVRKVLGSSVRCSASTSHPPSFPLLLGAPTPVLVVSNASFLKAGLRA